MNLVAVKVALSCPASVECENIKACVIKVQRCRKCCIYKKSFVFVFVCDYCGAYDCVCVGKDCVDQGYFEAQDFIFGFYFQGLA